MRSSFYIKSSATLLLIIMAGCTNLKEKYVQTVPQDQVVAAMGPQFPTLLLTGAYNDIPGPFVAQDQVFSLEENVADESLVPTRGGDWDDNGVWRVLHNHTWNADHAQVSAVFNNLNKLNFDATNVLQYNPSKEQAAEARFLRALSLYFLLDLYNQFPFRNPGDNLLLAPKVYSGDSAVLFIINELNLALTDISPTNPMTKGNADAAKVLLMRLYLNRGAFNNRAQPTFADADMQQVITLGSSIIAGNKYSYMPNYFDNFSSSNGTSTEGIFAYPASSGVSANNPGMDARWMMTFHYNEFDAQAPNAGWNGFSTISDFYNAFSLSSSTTFSRADTVLDTRLGARFTSNPQTTLASGIRPGFLVNQQYDQNGTALKDRKGNPLKFDPNIAANMIETGSNLEVTGIRIAKYVPDFKDASGKYYSSNPGNWLMLMRFPEVGLMVAEALMRQATPDPTASLAIVNNLRAARGAPAISTGLYSLNGSGLHDPNALLSELGREFYWESHRRTDLIRYGMFLVPWQYKPSDDAHFLVFPIPNSALALNPNLKQNAGY